MPGIISEGNKHNWHEEMIYAADLNQVVQQIMIRMRSVVGEAPSIPLRIEQGANFYRRFRLQDFGWQPYALTEKLIRMQIREAADAVGILKSLNDGTFNVRNYRFLTADASNIFDLRMNSEETAALDFGSAVYDIELVLAELTAVAFGGGYTSAAIVADNGSGQGTITANGGTPFSVFAAGDLVFVENAENSGNNGTYTVATRSDTVLTFTDRIGYGFGSDNATDTAIGMYIAVPDEANVVRLCRGSVKLLKEATR